MLVDAKTVTIARLMDIAPAGTVDPTPFLYDTTCFAAAGESRVTSHESRVTSYELRPLSCVVSVGGVCVRPRVLFVRFYAARATCHSHARVRLRTQPTRPYVRARTNNYYL